MLDIILARECRAMTRRLAGPPSSSNLSNGSKQSNNSKQPSLNGGGSLNTLVGSAIKRKEAYQDPIREYVDTYSQLTELRKFMVKESLDY